MSPSSKYVYYQILKFPETNQSELDQSTIKQKSPKCLDGKLRFPVFLPYELSRQTSTSDRQKTLSSLPKIPILAKFSTKLNLLAIQISPTVVIVARVKQEQNTKIRKTKKAEFWTIDLEKEHPPAFPESFPENWDFEAQSTTLLPGGVIW